MSIKSLIAILFTASVTLTAQTTSVKPSVLTGEARSVDASAIVLQTKDAAVNVEITAATEFKRVPPENPTLRAAVPAVVTDIGVGDKLMVTGILSDDKMSIPARAVYIMTKADISQKNQAESQRWATRGIAGKISAVNADTGQLTIDVRGLMGTQSVTVTPKPGAKILRYKQDSVSYSEAQPSSFADIKPGDMIRALGDRSSDGLSFAAEEVVTGAFKTVAGTVKSVDAAANELTIGDLASGSDITVAIGPGSALKKFPEEMAQRMAMMGAGGGATGQTGQPGAGARPAGETRPAGQPAGDNAGGERPAGPGRGGARAGIDDMFERFPVITVADLKVGDMIAVSSTNNGTTSRVTAIKLLAGVEPFIRAAQMQNAAGGRGRGGQQGAFTIPGLDGFDFPNQ